MIYRNNVSAVYLKLNILTQDLIKCQIADLRQNSATEDSRFDIMLACQAYSIPQWWWQIWRNYDWQRRKYSEKGLSKVTLHTSIHTCTYTVLGLNLGLYNETCISNCWTWHAYSHKSISSVGLQRLLIYCHNFPQCVS